MVSGVSSIKEGDPQAGLQTQCNPNQDLIGLFKCNFIQADFQVKLEETMFKCCQEHSEREQCWGDTCPPKH